jgi:hypothetical protein
VGGNCRWGDTSCPQTQRAESWSPQRPLLVAPRLRAPSSAAPGAAFFPTATGRGAPTPQCRTQRSFYGGHSAHPSTACPTLLARHPKRHPFPRPTHNAVCAWARAQRVLLQPGHAFPHALVRRLPLAPWARRPLPRPTYKLFLTLWSGVLHPAPRRSIHFPLPTHSAVRFRPRMEGPLPQPGHALPRALARRPSPGPEAGRSFLRPAHSAIRFPAASTARTLPRPVHAFSGAWPCARHQAPGGRHYLPRLTHGAVVAGPRPASLSGGASVWSRCRSTWSTLRLRMR